MPAQQGKPRNDAASQQNNPAYEQNELQHWKTAPLSLLIPRVTVRVPRWNFEQSVAAHCDGAGQRADNRPTGPAGQSSWGWGCDEGLPFAKVVLWGD